MENHAEHRIYPDHLYDPTRRQIAVELLEKEINKQLLGDTQDVNLDVRSWLDKMDEHTFWNAIEGFMGGTMLKPIVHFLTAENYSWSQMEIPVRDIQLSSKLTQLDALSGLQSDQLQLSAIQAQLALNPEEHARQVEAVQSFSKSYDQDAYPIIAVEKEGGPMVMDGNRRALQSLLLGRATINAWYCRTNNEQPRNFWYPIDDMMRLTQVYNTSKDNNPGIKQNVQGVLNAIFAQSDVARIAYRDRIVKVGTPGARELLDE